jgi:radical SAM protein with 4Fe4S-binding SPASM domain
MALEIRPEGGTSATDALRSERTYDFDPNETYNEIVYRDDWKKYRSPAYAQYRDDWDRVPRNKIKLDFPLHLDIETTNICNLQCPMCPRTVLVESGAFSELGMMTREEYANIIDQGVEHGVRSIKLNYLGEPLAHKDVVWQVAYAKQHGVLDVMMNSNASLLRKEIGRELLEAGLDALFVSFDAISPDLYADRRVGTSIGKVIDNVYDFVKLRNEKYPQVQVRLSMVMYDDPLWMDQFQGLQLMWKNLVDAVGYGFYTERDPNAQVEFPEVKGFWCAQPFQRMFLKYNGNVTICCVDDKDEVVLGNWREQGLHAIWNSEAYDEIRRLHASGNYYKMAMCRKCYLPVTE